MAEHGSMQAEELLPNGFCCLIRLLTEENLRPLLAKIIWYNLSNNLISDYIPQP